MTTRSLRDLTSGLVGVPIPGDISVSDVTLDSRTVSPGALFLACRGGSHHGLEFAQQAVARGARAVLYEGDEKTKPTFGSEIFVAAVPHLSRHVGMIADRFFGAPAQALTVAGITGTNGKTTCAWLLAQALQICNRRAGFVGTLGFGIPPALSPTEHTTSDAVNLHRQFAALRELGAECVSMEVSSHAIDQHRVAAVRFETAAFTNLTRDHLDYHRTMEAYGATKARLLSWPNLAHRVINIDDPFGARLAAEPSPARLVITSRRAASASAARAHGARAENVAAAVDSLRGAEMVGARQVTCESAGLRISTESSWGAGELAVPLIGEFNVDNVLTVLAVLLAWNIPLSQAAAALAMCRPPSGRMETFGGTNGLPLAIVDYAHTPDGLTKALSAARAHCHGRLRVVFGCGGDRDPGKRPMMGRIASELADEAILTDDNPRTEDPAKIIAGVLQGFSAPGVPLVEHDRAVAIRTGLQRSGPDDVVLVAGKGHEDYQIYGSVRRPFSDQAIIRATFGIGPGGVRA
jgi:UDP-N-acetylmuramoyl-L-alanyl-D-glutamate--2,6-diaminopimelate ligase